MSEIAPHLALLRITGNVMLARCIGIAAEIGVADAIETGHGRLTTSALAKLTGSHEQALYRMMRYMAANGIFNEDAEGKFQNTDISKLLRTGVPGSMRESVSQSWQDVMWDVYKAFPHTIATGEPAFNQTYGASFCACTLLIWKAQPASVVAPPRKIHAVGESGQWNDGTIVSIKGIPHPRKSNDPSVAAAPASAQRAKKIPKPNPMTAPPAVTAKRNVCVAGGTRSQRLLICAAILPPAPARSAILPVVSSPAD